MSEFAERKPRQLSGGEQQRIALARCLATDPKVLLLDEPFGALDKNLRLDMQIEVKRLQRVYGITTILVTHDQEEALSMADRIAVMARGSIEQVSSPTEIYDRPKTLFVNQFVGTANVVPGEFVSADHGVATVRVMGGAVLKARETPQLVSGAPVLVSVRPEQLRLESTPGDGRIAGVVKAVMPLGPHVVYEVETSGGTSLKVSEPRAAAAALRRPGESVHVAAAFDAACRVFPKS
jgi:putative spermidine/putrescine transport system ATP-binding protein